MPITSFPPAPSRAVPATFADLADAYLGHLENPFVAEANALEANVNAKEASAVAASNAAVAVANAPLWISGTTYALGFAVYDPVDLLTYRRKIAGAGTTRPGLDATNWVRVVGTGNARTDQSQTFTGVNTFSLPIVGSGANLTALNASNIATGTVGAARLGSGTANSATFLRGNNTWSALASADVLTVIAGSTFGAVGTYAYLAHTTGATTLTAGSTYAGSVLRASGHQTNASNAASFGFAVDSGSTLSGTWLAMGTAISSDAEFRAQTLCLRIS